MPLGVALEVDVADALEDEDVLVDKVRVAEDEAELELELDADAVAEDDGEGAAV